MTHAKRYDQLFGNIASFAALHEAAMQAIKGKRKKPGAAAFMANLGRELLRLERTLLDGSWRSGGYTVIDVRDPKPRRVGTPCPRGDYTVVRNYDCKNGAETRMKQRSCVSINTDL